MFDSGLAVPHGYRAGRVNAHADYLSQVSNLRQLFRQQAAAASSCRVTLQAPELKPASYVIAPEVFDWTVYQQHAEAFRARWVGYIGAETHSAD